MTKWERVETAIEVSDAGQYRVHTTAKDPYTGKIRHRRATLKPGSTIEDARAKVMELKADVSEQRYQPQRKAVDVESYAQLWLARKMDGPKPLKPSTADTYAYALEVFCDFCGAVDLTSITRVDVIGYRDWLQRLRKPDGKKYATNSLGAWWRPVVTMLRDAVADDLLHKDPTYRVDSPATKAKTGRELRTLSGSELWALIDAMRKVCPDRAAETAVLCYTGMRSGELWALTWGDIDWGGPRLHIRQSVSLDVVMEGTKTVDDRDTYMPDVVGFALAEWYQQRRKDGYDVSDDALVFPSTRDATKPRQRGSLKKALKLARKAAGIEQHVNTRVLRRSYNTLMRSLGVDWIVLQSMMGHSSDEMTSRYSGVRLEEKRGAVLKLIQGGAA